MVTRKNLKFVSLEAAKREAEYRARETDEAQLVCPLITNHGGAWDQPDRVYEVVKFSSWLALCRELRGPRVYEFCAHP